MKFTKMQGLGNDFVLIDARFWTLPQDVNGWAKRICDRHYGIGADGVMLVLPSMTADIRMRILNSDGSEPEMCGNGIRCFAKFVYEEGIVPSPRMQVETLAGIITPEVWDACADGKRQVRVDMGEPILERARIPMTGAGERAVNVPVVLGDKTLAITAVSMGNPHCVTFVEDMAAVDIAKWGAQLENSPYFPKKTNVEFVQVCNDAEVVMRVWERGDGITLACGTGACATAVAGVLNGQTGRQITVHLDGGDLLIYWDETSNHVFMTGAAVTVFAGEMEM